MSDGGQAREASTGDAAPTAAEITTQIRGALRARYRDQGWELFQRAPGDVLLEEVQLAGRSADAIRVGCWKSRGYTLEGFEIKASRGDWLRELKHPAKADEIARYMDRWWVVAPTGIVKPDELPPGWGLMQLRKDGKLVVKTPAPKRQPDPPNRYVVAMLTRAAFMASRGEMTRQRYRLEEWARKEIARELKRRDPDEYIKRELDKLKEDVAAFEAVSGIRIRDTWRRGGEIGSVVKWALKYMHDLRRRERVLAGALSLLDGEKRRLEDLRSVLLEALPPLAHEGGVS
ncbi:MAG: hypothetical protein ACE5FA_04110 [Dehalococcoidia bacterium]